MPTNFQRSGARYILSEVKMSYQPLFATILGRLMKTVNLKYDWSETVAWPVRGGQSEGTGLDSEVILPNGTKCNAKLT